MKKHANVGKLPKKDGENDGADAPADGTREPDRRTLHLCLHCLADYLIPRLTSAIDPRFPATVSSFARAVAFHQETCYSLLVCPVDNSPDMRKPVERDSVRRDNPDWGFAAAKEVLLGGVGR